MNRLSRELLRIAEEVEGASRSVKMKPMPERHLDNMQPRSIDSKVDWSYVRAHAAQEVKSFSNSIELGDKFKASMEKGLSGAFSKFRSLIGLRSSWIRSWERLKKSLKASEELMSCFAGAKSEEDVMFWRDSMITRSGSSSLGNTHPNYLYNELDDLQKCCSGINQKVDYMSMDMFVTQLDRVLQEYESFYNKIWDLKK